MSKKMGASVRAVTSLLFELLTDHTGIRRLRKIQRHYQGCPSCHQGWSWTSRSHPRRCQREALPASRRVCATKRNSHCDWSASWCPHPSTGLRVGAQDGQDPMLICRQPTGQRGGSRFLPARPHPCSIQDRRSQGSAQGLRPDARGQDHWPLRPQDARHRIEAVQMTKAGCLYPSKIRI